MTNFDINMFKQKLSQLAGILEGMSENTEEVQRKRRAVYALIKILEYRIPTVIRKTQIGEFSIN